LSRSETRDEAVYDDYLAGCAAGRPEDPAAVLARHPDLGPEVRTRIEALWRMRSRPLGGAPRTPERLGGYRLVERLDSGGMGTVHRAVREADGADVAVKVLLPEPLGVEEIEYRSVLVAFEEDEPFSEEMVATAVKLASKRRRGIHVHSMLTVPPHLALDAELPEQESEAQTKIEQAKLIGGQRVTGHVERVRPGQAGYSIADEAEMIKAAAVVVGLRYRNGRPHYDKTLQTVLGERPCRVIVVSQPPLESQAWTPPTGSTAALSASSRSSSSPSA